MVEANREEGIERQEGVGEERERGKKERKGREQAWEEKVRKARILTGSPWVLSQLEGLPLPVLSVDFILACRRAQTKYSVCHQLQEEAAAYGTPVLTSGKPSPSSKPAAPAADHSVNPRTCLLYQSELWLNAGRRRLYHPTLKYEEGPSCFPAGALRCSSKFKAVSMDKKGKGSLWEGLFSRAEHVRFLVPECLWLLNAIPCLISKHSFLSSRKMACPFCQNCTWQVK